MAMAIVFLAVIVGFSILTAWAIQWLPLWGGAILVGYLFGSIPKAMIESVQRDVDRRNQ